MPIDEAHPRRAASPYGRTKQVIEMILEDLAASDPAWSVALLRYFNPVGAHASGLIGEDPRGVPNNLMPFVAQVAVGRRPEVRIFGDDYDTPDGTGVRDYIHVVRPRRGPCRRGRLGGGRRGAGRRRSTSGSGEGTAVLEIVAAFARAAGRPIPHVVAPRRAGDVAVCYADPAQGLRAARLAPDARARRDVRERLGLAVAEPGRLRQLTAAGRPQASYGLEREQSSSANRRKPEGNNARTCAPLRGNGRVPHASACASVQAYVAAPAARRSGARCPPAPPRQAGVGQSSLRSSRRWLSSSATMVQIAPDSR